jgi:FlaA1/EpsC-like NDP-sugar epimerase
VIRVWNRVDQGALGLLRAIIRFNRATKVGALLILDAFLCIVAVWIAFSVRLGEWILWSPAIAMMMALSLLFWLPIFFWRGIYNSIVRYIGSRTMVGIATSCIMMGIGLAIVLVIGGFPGVPRTVAFIQPMVFAVLLVFSRLIARYVLLDLLNQRSSPGRRQGVLIYGAGSAGRQLALSMRHEANMVLRGYIDDDRRLVGKHLDGVSIHGSEHVAQLIERMDVRTILLALPGASRQQREHIVRKFENISVKVLTLPALCDLLSGSVSVGDLRAIDITDLLGRDPVSPDELLLHRTIRQLTVMVTGAGGSIGSELCRQIVQLDPDRIVLVEMTEHALYAIEGELREMQEARGRARGPTIHAELGNIADADTVRRLFDRWRPDTVFHAAAYKHVPLVEENVIAGMRNNIGGTLNCALEADRTGVKHFILVSTDKAVRPTNVMGASKRVCELILQGLAARGSRTRFAMVRFGNVLGSSGSVVPRFQQQIQKGGPVTLTHRDVTRYFMTIPEAAQLVIQAGGMAEGGEVYVLNMGDPIRIYDLARTMIHLSGLTVRDTSNLDGDIEICEVGLRKGEKLYEELLIGDSPAPTQHLRIMQAREKFIDWKTLTLHLNDLDRFLSKGDRLASLEILSTVVPEYIGVQSIRRSTAA